MQQQKLLSGARIDLLLLVLIVITGATLRLVHFDKAPFTHDEIDNLGHTGYSNFNELIEKAVKPDVHPPLLLLFINYYTKIFGTSEMAVKLPFVICGILSIVLVYLIAAKWFGRTAALLSAAVVSTVQYTVMYSLIARHYSPGLFLTLLLVYCQQKFFEADDKKRIRWLAAFTLTGVACSYLHYFCLFFTAIVAVTGFLFVSRKNFRHYFIACALIPLLFVPYLPVFFVQFGYKGVGGPEGWLGVPDSGLFLNYLRYIFHYSDVFLLLVMVLFLCGIILRVARHEKVVSKYRLISLAWFAIPLLTGYFYSIKVNPVLQYSSLIFSFPYLLMFLFSFFNDIKPILKTLMVVLILSVGTITLVHGRKHYGLFYNQGIHKVISGITKAQAQFGNDSVDAVINVEDYFLDYYNKNFPLDKNSRYLALSHSGDLRSLINIASQSKKNYFVYGTVERYPLECRQIVKEYFPYVVSEYKGHLTEIIICSKIPVPPLKLEKINFPWGFEGKVLKIIFSSENNFTAKGKGWNFNEQKVMYDSLSTKKYFRYELSDEFGVEFKLPLDELIKNKNNLLHVRADAFMEDTAGSPLLVMSMESGSNTVDWRAVKFSDYLKPGERGDVYLSLRFSDIHINTQNTVLKVYIWNNDKSAFNLFNLKVSIENGNPYFYGLFEEF